MIYDALKQKVHQVTSDYYNEFFPIFDPEGNYLFFYSNLTFRPVYGDMDDTWIYPNSTNVCAATLTNIPRTKYTPSVIATEEPVAAASVAIVVAETVLAE